MNYQKKNLFHILIKEKFYLKKLERNIIEFLKGIQKKYNGTIKLENFWTSKKPLNGLRHFVLVNEKKEKENIIFLMVSVLDSDINFKISYEELINSGNWIKGWINLPKLESITGKYSRYKSNNKGEEIDKIFIEDDSLFNIS